MRDRRSAAAGERRSGDGGEYLSVGGPNAVEAALAATAGGDREPGAAEGARLRAPVSVHRVFLEDSAGRRAETVAEAARHRGIPVSRMGRGECDEMSGVRCQGIAADIRYGYADLDEVLAGPPGLLLVLDGINDPHNLGALIRTAEAAGALAVVIPARRAAQVNATVMRVSAGAAAWLPVCRVTNLTRAIEGARGVGFWAIGLDHEADHVLAAGSAGAVPGQSEGPTEGDKRQPASALDGAVRVALVLGGEGEGMHRLVREACDELARLPMEGSVESLNASVAGAIAVYRLLDRALFGRADS